jgi:putative phosphoesterase
MKIAIISDTHGFLDNQVIKHLQDADEIWHAGDIGTIEVIDKLEQLTGRLRLVYGNIDSQKIRLIAPEAQGFTIDGCRILMIHIAGNMPGYNAAVRAYIGRFRPNILVCGHSHILKVMNDKRNNLLFINPGSCGHHGIHKVRTMIKFEIIDGKPANMNVIEFGKRGMIN